jgi:hypothetical protein
MMTNPQNENPAQAENVNFEEMLDSLKDLAISTECGTDHVRDNQLYDDQRQALLDYVHRLEARQMHPDFDEMYALFVRDEKRGDPALRDMRFAGYAAAFFTRFLRLVDPDWANEEGEG